MTAREVLDALEPLLSEDALLASFWATVFEAPDPNEEKPSRENHNIVHYGRPVEPGTMFSDEEYDAILLAWETAREVKRGRAGQLHPDAAFDIARYLQARGLDVTENLVMEAKELERTR